ncbi:MAG: hypothetical protein GX219_04145 [Tissierellia bacterium]|nr:hypothetical protein [Tissierellia bacterium]
MKIEERAGDVYLYVTPVFHPEMKDTMILKFVDGEIIEMEEMDLSLDSEGNSSRKIQ